MKQFFTIIMIAFSVITFSQNIQTIDGVEYIMHKTKKKETLYGLSKQYGVSIEELKAANPELKNGLKKKMMLKIPQKKKEVVKEEDPKNGTHIVQSGETAYGIAKKYNMSVEELVKANAGKTQNLKPGDVLSIPGKAVASNNTSKQSLKQGRIIEHTVESGETAYSLAKKYETTLDEIKKLNPSLSMDNLPLGTRIKIRTKAMLMNPIKLEARELPVGTDFNTVNEINPLKDKLEKMVMKDAYNVSLLLPFMIDKNARVQKNRKPNDPIRMYQLTEMSTHFYQGVQLALDTLKKAGVSINLNVYDTRKDTGYVNKLIKTEELLTSDLIVGPFYEKTYNKVTEFAKAQKIQLACPVEQSNKSLFNNPYVSKLKASLPTQAAYLAKYIAEHYNNENVVLVSGKSKKDKYLADLIEKIYNDSIKNKTNNYKATITRYNFSSYRDMSGMSSKLTSSKKNIVLFPSTDLGLATSFFTQFNVVMNKTGMHKHEVAIYALENFKSYENIDIDHRVKYNLHITSSYFIDNNDNKIKKFILKYRKRFGTDPNDFAFMGYDAMVYNGMALQSFGKTHADYYNYIKIPLLHTKYQLEKKDEGSGYENKQVYILSYADYELNKIE